MMPACHIEPVEVQVLVAISFNGQLIGGPAVIQLDDTSYRLTMLSPGGVEVFSISGQEGTVSVTGPDAWTPYLKRLPIERDLRLMFTTADCKAAKGTFYETDTGADYRGCYGRASMTLEGARVVTDRRRAYSLKVVGLEDV